MGPFQNANAFIAMLMDLQTRHFAAFGAAIEVWDHFAAFAAFREANFKLKQE